MIRQNGYRALLTAVRMLVCAVLVSLLASCTTSQKMVVEEDELARVSAVAVVRPGFFVRPGETIAWRTEMLWVGKDSEGAYRRALTSLDIQGEIERQFEAQGLSFVKPASADYVLVAVVMLGDVAEGSAMRELTRLYPALGSVSQTLEKGTLMLGVSHPGSPVVLWRGAIQTYLSGEIPPAERAPRLRGVVRSLIKTLPIRD